MKNYLNFESDIKNLEDELDKLKDPYNQSGLSEVDTQKISKTQEELDEKYYMKAIDLTKLMTSLVNLSGAACKKITYSYCCMLIETKILLWQMSIILLKYLLT